MHRACRKKFTTTFKSFQDFHDGDANKKKHKKLKFDYKKLVVWLTRRFLWTFFTTSRRCFEGEHKLISERQNGEQRMEKNPISLMASICSFLKGPSPDLKSEIMHSHKVQRAVELRHVTYFFDLALKKWQQAASISFQILNDKSGFPRLAFST